jgi:hypothetical protein
MHGALLLDLGETSNEAVVRKLPPEAKLGLFLNEVSDVREAKK